MFRGRPQAESTSGALQVSATQGILVLTDHANVPVTYTLFKERQTYTFSSPNGISTSADKKKKKTLLSNWCDWEIFQKVTDLALSNPKYWTCDNFKEHVRHFYFPSIFTSLT